LHGTGREDVGLAFAHDELRVLAVFADIDAIQARPGQHDLRVRRVDARRFAGLENPHAHVDAALRDEHRELAIIELRHMQTGVAREPELPRAEVDLGATVFADPQIVAARYRVVEPDGHPLVGLVLRRQEEFTTHIGDAADTSGRIIVGERHTWQRERSCGGPNQERCEAQELEPTSAGWAADCTAQYRGQIHGHRVISLVDRIDNVPGRTFVDALPAGAGPVLL
jgi:hypothetical protein